jgi:C4-dicarboxylate transporter DctM subunit
VYDLSVVPLFLLMGNSPRTAACRGGCSRPPTPSSATTGRRGDERVGACAGFGAICGSSLATAATMGQVALPELRRYRYSPALPPARWRPAAPWAS